jgi:hypothetical protein
MSEMPQGVAPPIRLFYSYAREDEVFRHALDKHLSALKRTGVIAPWHDRRIVPGVDWAREIDQHLKDAHLILLLVSADFLDSDYCWGVEMKRALEMHRTGSARVVPVMVRPVDIEGVPFANLQALPGGAKPITEWRNVDTAWADVAKGIRAAALDVRDHIHTRAAQGADDRLVPAQPEQEGKGGERRSVEHLDAEALHALYEAYWAEFSELVAHSDVGLRPPTPRASNYVRLSLGESDMWMQTFVSVRRGFLGVELIMRSRRLPAYESLKAVEEQIDKELGAGLEWREQQDTSRIVQSRTGYNPADRADWPRQHRWLIEKVKAYQQHLVARIRADPGTDLTTDG